MQVTVPALWDYKKYGDCAVAAWFKKEGSVVRKNDLLCHVMVKKVTYDVRSPVTGRVTRIIAPKGSMLKPGEPLVEIEELAEAEVVALAEAKPVLEAPVPAKAVRATPAAKRVARELGVDLGAVTASGPAGLVTEEDVRKFAEAGRPAYKTMELAGLRKIIADRMFDSLRTSAQLTIQSEVDVSELAEMREKELKDMGVSYTDLVVKAVAQALREHQYMNAHVNGDEVKVFESINIGVAIAVEQGILVPVVKDADKKGLRQLSAEINELSSLAMQGASTPEQLSGSTFTVTNLGMYGVDYFTPIINPPEVGILGVGRMTEKLAYEGGHVKVRKVMRLSLTFDHRVVDGAPAAEFLAKVTSILSTARQSLTLG